MNKDDQAYPTVAKEQMNSALQAGTTPVDIYYPGFTKGERMLIEYRKAALAGLLANPNSEYTGFKLAAEHAKQYAKAMLELDDE